MAAAYAPRHVSNVKLASLFWNRLRHVKKLNMKRSRQIKLVLSGAMAAGLFSSCTPDPDPAVQISQISTNQVYTNNHYIHGIGYYHAPYRSWFLYPYNYYDPGRGYYHGGNWSPTPHQSDLKRSYPTGQSVSSLRSSSLYRSSFGSSGFSSGSSSSSGSSGISRSGFGGFGHSSVS